MEERVNDYGRLDLIARSMDETLAFAQRDACRWGFNEAAALLVVARESVREEVAKLRGEEYEPLAQSA